ncbi:DUF3127 domain-containing protein [Sphingobacterium kyonggiense]
MQITGHVHEVGQTQQVSESFKKRDLIVVVAENPQYPEYIRVEATQDKTTLFDGLKQGDGVTVDVNLRGRPWTNKEGITTYFNSIVACKLAKTGSIAPTPDTTPQPAMAPIDISQADDDDDLPF